MNLFGAGGGAEQAGHILETFALTANAVYLAPALLSQG
jgi:hypothetical protein